MVSRSACVLKVNTNPETAVSLMIAVLAVLAAVALREQKL
jgi:hypothetical protein